MKLMDNVIRKFILSLWILVLWLSAFPGISNAEGADNQACNRFWAKCHVSDIKTIHTDDEGPNARLLDTIKNAINRCLGILATVVLCFCMYWWFKMLSSWSDSKWYDAWWKILQNALIWLAIILLAWMIVSVVFWFVGTLSGWNQTQATGAK